MMMRTLKNEKGILTLDFIFASMLIFGLSSVIFSFGMTLSVVEVVQYMSFASARNYSLAHLNEDRQRQRGEQKFQELATNPIFSSMLDLGWFDVEPVKIDDFNDDYSPDSSFESNNFVGARIPFGAPILYKRIPLVGNTASDPEAFKVNIQSFLAREPTFQECLNQNTMRAQMFSSLSPTYSNFSINETFVMMDNGC